MNEVKEKCPRCGRELEEGTIFAPRGIFWDRMGEEHKWTWMGSETLLSQWSLKNPRATAWRCSSCNLVIFLY